MICALGISYWPFGNFAFNKAEATGLIWLAEIVLPKLLLIAFTMPCALRSSVRPSGTVTSFVESEASAMRTP